MRGHLAPDWEVTPDRLLVWLLRVVTRGRTECPALTAQLTQALGPDAQEALAAVQLLSLALLRGGRLFEAEAPFASEFSPPEAAALAAVKACRCGERERAAAVLGPWAARCTHLAVEACAHLGAVFARRGLDLVPADAPLVAAE